MVGPYLLPNCLNGPTYCVFQQEVLPVLLEDVPLAVRHDMWFQHDGEPAHFSAQTHQHFNTQFPDRWLGCSGPNYHPLSYVSAVFCDSNVLHNSRVVYPDMCDLCIVLMNAICVCLCLSASPLISLLLMIGATLAPFDDSFLL
jgi:hypothetical protein